MPIPKDPKTKLTRKQKAFADELIRNPKQSATQAIMKTYNVAAPSTAKVMASENLTKPNVLRYLNKYLDEAETVVLNVMTNSEKLKDEPAHARIALESANSVIDRLIGKATQRIETQSTSVNLNLDLTNITDTHQG